MIPLASPRTCLLAALSVALLVVAMLMLTAPVRTAVEERDWTPQTAPGSEPVIYIEEAP